MPLSTDEIAPEADLSQMMARRWRSSAVAERTAALEIVHGATGHADSSLSDGLFFKKGFATAEGFRPSYWVYERPAEDRALANDPVALQPAPNPQRPAEEPALPLASIPNLLPPDETGEADEDESESIEPAVSPAASAGIEPEADLSKIMIRRTPFIRSADCDPAIAPAIEAATKAPLLEPLRSVDMVAAAIARKAALAQAAAAAAGAEATNPETEARAPVPLAPPSPAPSAPRAEPAPVVVPPARDLAKPPAKPVPGTDGLVVAQLTQVIESVLSSKSYSSQQDAAALRTARERPDARQKAGNAAQAAARLPSTGSAAAGGRSASSKPGDGRIVLGAVWRIGRVSALAIVVTLLAEYFLNAWLAGG